jgi:aryl-alcohol dehydrogenase-like predicted oxidoreductase
MAELLKGLPVANALTEALAVRVEKLKEKGVIRHIGVSNFSKEQILEAEKYAKIDVQQPKYCMVDRPFEDLIKWGYEKGIDSLTYGSMGAGILSGKYRTVPNWDPKDIRLNFYDYFREPKFSKIQELLKTLDVIAEAHNKPVTQVALNWSTQKDWIGTALVGVRSEGHANENCATFDWELTAEEMTMIDKKLEEVGL